MVVLGFRLCRYIDRNIVRMPKSVKSEIFLTPGVVKILFKAEQIGGLLTKDRTDTGGPGGASKKGDAEGECKTNKNQDKMADEEKEY